MDGSGGVYVPKWLLRASLYSAGPFFCYPHKPLLALLEGSPYARSYLHFRRDHHNGTNLVLHCLALVYQLGSNFALLNEADKVLIAWTGAEDEAPVSQATAAIWAAMMLATPGAPLSVRMASGAAIAVAYTRRRALARRWREAALGLSIFEGVIIHILLRQRSLSDVVPLTLTVVTRVALQYFATANRGRLARQRRPLTAGVLLAVAAASLSARTKLNVFRYALLAGPLAVLTDQPWLYFWSCAYQASLLQGAAHRATAELATLPQLAEHVADEFGHTTYFPNLLLHSVYDSVTGAAAAATT